MQAWRAKLIAKRLREGAVIACPTEGCWSLGCDPGKPEAVSRILTMKRRSWTEGLTLVAGDLDQVEPLINEVSDEERKTLEHEWPGVATFLIPNSTAPAWIRGAHESVAVRVSAHPVIRGICAEFRKPIVLTPANPAGKPPATTTLRLRQYFRGSIDDVVPGDIGGVGRPSELRKLRVDIKRTDV